MKPNYVKLATGIVLMSLVALLATACAAPSPTPPSAPPPPTQPPMPTATPVPPTGTVPPSPMPTAKPTVAPQPGLPLATFATGFFTGAGNCAICHTGITDAAGKDVSFDTQWRPGMMTNSAKDPYWLAQVESEVERFPELKATIEQICSTCHMPMAHTEAVATGQASMILDNGFLNAGHPLHQVAIDGVSCTLCHQIQPDGLGTPASFSGGYVIDTATALPNRLIFGAFSNLRGQVMSARVGYVPLYGEHMTRSELCATCHVLYTPFVDAQGNVKGEFPEQTPYLEWEHSEFGDGAGTDVQCQECHMPAATGSVPLSVVPRNLPPRSPVRQHTFTGGNTLMLKMHQANVAELGLTASTEHLEQALAETTTLLQTRTARVSIPEATVSGDTLTAVVLVENQTGHKFPTSFPSRRAWIHLTVTDASGKVVFESGKPAADGSIAGCDADADVKTYEPHHDAITSPEQVQIYEPIMGNTEGEVTYTLVRGARYLKDNRILPRGFDKATAHKDIAVYGSAADDANFVGGSDRVTYRIPVSGFAGPFRVEAQVLYQSISYRFAEDLREEHGAHVQQFMRMWDATDKTPALVAAATAVVQ